jgi:hypothetical protein
MDPASGRVLTEVAEAGLDLVDGTWAWSTNSRFLLYRRSAKASGRWTLVFYDTATGSSTEVPLSDIVDEIRITDPAPPPGDFMELPPGGPELEVDASGAAATGGTPLPDFANAASVDRSECLPLGVVTEIHPDNRLDFLYERCDGESACYRDVFVNRDDPSLVSAGWQAGRPFHVRHGFINESDDSTTGSMSCCTSTKTASRELVPPTAMHRTMCCKAPPMRADRPTAPQQAQ